MQTLLAIAHKMLPFFIRVLCHLDPHIWAPLAPHQQKIICFQIEGLSPLYFQITPEGLAFIQAPAEHANVTFSGPLTAFMFFVITQKLSHKELHIRGDLECAKAFYDVWQQMDIDWEGHLATVMGPALARLFYQSLQQTQQWLKNTWQARQQDLSAFLQDEIQILPSSIEMEIFFQDIALIRDDVERLDARMQRIQKVLTRRE